MHPSSEVVLLESRLKNESPLPRGHPTRSHASAIRDLRIPRSIARRSRDARRRRSTRRRDDERVRLARRRVFSLLLFTRARARARDSRRPRAPPSFARSRSRDARATRPRRREASRASRAREGGGEERSVGRSMRSLAVDRSSERVNAIDRSTSIAVDRSIVDRDRDRSIVEIAVGRLHPRRPTRRPFQNGRPRDDASHREVERSSATREDASTDRTSRPRTGVREKQTRIPRASRAGGRRRRDDEDEDATDERA